MYYVVFSIKIPDI